MKRLGLGWALAALLHSMAASAEGARVEAVQYPAWLERGGYSVPLTPGLQLRALDKLRTGGNARVRLALGEGSVVRLGENAEFVIERAESRGVFRGALAVLSGAFRFTTQALRRTQGRDIAIKVRNVTIGIRGTDLWGKSTAERDLVCLLEGKIAVGSAGNPEVTLDQPLAFYQKPRDGAPVVDKVDAKQVEIWARETEIARDGGAASVGGAWRVVAGRFEGRNDALALNRTLHARGYPAEVGREPGGVSFVQVTGLAGEAEARAVMANIRNIPGVAIPTVSLTPR
jgi:hypothetical protein